MLNFRSMSKKNLTFMAGGAFLLLVAFLSFRGTSESFAFDSRDLQKELLEGGVPEVHTLGVVLPSSHYQMFSEISLKVTEGKIEDSLRGSLALKAKIEKSLEESPQESYLYTLNLYRIGVLQKALGQVKEEKETWEELEGIISGRDERKYLMSSGLSLVESLSSEETSLKEYFIKRKKELENASSN